MRMVERLSPRQCAVNEGFSRLNAQAGPGTTLD